MYHESSFYTSDSREYRDFWNAYLENKQKEQQFMNTIVFKTWLASSKKNEDEMRF